jgi:hypothetical protein
MQNYQTVPGYYAHAEIGYKHTGSDGALFECSLFSYLSLSKKLDPTLRSRLQTEEFTGAMLSCSDGHSKDRVLVVDSIDNVTERIGVVEFSGTASYADCDKRTTRDCTL